MTTILSIFNEDLTHMNEVLAEAGAIITEPVSGVRRVDTTRVPADVVSAYKSLVQFGRTNGLLR